jgi:hypothetical protein
MTAVSIGVTHLYCLGTPIPRSASAAGVVPGLVGPGCSTEATLFREADSLPSVPDPLSCRLTMRPPPDLVAFTVVLSDPDYVTVK